MNKVLATLIAGLFAAGAFAQAPVAPAKTEAKVEKKADAAPMKAEKKSKHHKKAAPKAEPAKK